MTIKQIDHRRYRIPRTGHPRLHENLAWFATEGDEVLGVVVRDLIDRDFGWVVLTEHADGYRAVDLGCSLPTVDQATAKLHIAMMERRA
jgi:hypothetical protein